MLTQRDMQDIIVVDGDPLLNIRESKNVRYTLQGGKVYEADSMKRVGPGGGVEPRLWWR